MIQRIIKIKELKSKSEREFAYLIGSNQKTINQQIKGERALSLDTVENILSSFEDISAEWLLRGLGSMYKTEAANSNEIELLKKEIECKDQMIEMLMNKLSAPNAVNCNESKTRSA